LEKQIDREMRTNKPMIYKGGQAKKGGAHALLKECGNKEKENVNFLISRFALKLT